MKYPRNEIWVRKVYEELILNGKLTTLFRPGDRIGDNKKTKYFNKGEGVIVRVLEKPGDEERNIEPEFSPLIRKARIKEMKKVDLSSLLREDFEDSYPNVTNQDTLRYNLGLTYNKRPDSFSRVTKIKIKYLD